MNGQNMECDMEADMGDFSRIPFNPEVSIDATSSNDLDDVTALSSAVLSCTRAGDLVEQTNASQRIQAALDLLLQALLDG
jgi:hypothetical protein